MAKPISQVYLPGPPVMTNMVLTGGHDSRFANRNIYAFPLISYPLRIPDALPTPAYYYTHIVPLSVVPLTVFAGGIPQQTSRAQFSCPRSVDMDIQLHCGIAVLLSGTAYLSWVVPRDFPTRGLPKDFLAQAATNPPSVLLIVRIVNRPQPYPWEIRVTPRTWAAFVTVEDVLLTVYKNLRMRVAPSELGYILGISQAMRTRINEAFHIRCTRSVSPRREQRKGIRRIDYLGGKNSFSRFTLADGETLNTQGWLQTVVLEMEVS